MRMPKPECYRVVEWGHSGLLRPQPALPAEDMRSDIRLRLGMDTFCADVCPHINADGVACGAICDRQGRHLLCCPSGGGYFVCHDNVCAIFRLLAADIEGIPGVQDEFPDGKSSKSGKASVENCSLTATPTA